MDLLLWVQPKPQAVYYNMKRHEVCPQRQGIFQSTGTRQ